MDINHFNMGSTGMLDKQNTIMWAAPRKFYKARRF